MLLYNYDLTVIRLSWPAFTASVTFELFKKRDNGNEGSYLQTVLGGLISYGRPRLQSEHCEVFPYYIAIDSPTLTLFVICTCRILLSMCILRRSNALPE